jgi:uncharacterized protein (TIGR03086 family)
MTSPASPTARLLDLAPVCAETARVALGVTDAQLDAPTPCAGTSLAQLLDHLLGLAVGLTDAARKTWRPDQRPGGFGGACTLDPDWRVLLPARLEELAAAWREPAAYDGTTRAGGVELSGSEAAVVALDEVVLHGWDVAAATGQTYTVDEASTQVVIAFAGATAAPGAAVLRAGLFGPVVPVPEDAPAFDRALGLAGRDPAWRPPGS